VTSTPSFGVRASAHLSQEHADQVFEVERAVVHVSADESSLGKLSLDRAHEAPRVVVRDELLDRALADEDPGPRQGNKAALRKTAGSGASGSSSMKPRERFSSAAPRSEFDVPKSMA